MRDECMRPRDLSVCCACVCGGARVRYQLDNVEVFKMNVELEVLSAQLCFVLLDMRNVAQADLPTPAPLFCLLRW